MKTNLYYHKPEYFTDNYYKEYVGIAYDEFKRYEKTQNGHKKYPLIEWKVTEGMALKYCYDNCLQILSVFLQNSTFFF